MSKQKILVVSFSPLHRDTRVKRQIRALCRDYRVTAAGYTDPEIERVEFWKLEKIHLSLFERILRLIRLKLRLFSFVYAKETPVVSFKKKWEQEGKPGFDLIVANDFDTLPISLDIAGNAPVFFDAHEYFPAQRDHWWWRFKNKAYRRWLAKKYLPQAAGMSTVSKNIARAYQKNYGVDPVLVLNTPGYTCLEPGKVLPHAIKLVHHGGAIRERGLEELIRLMNYLDNHFTLDFYLLPSSEGYLEELKALAAVCKGQIDFKDPVPVDQLMDTLNQYDVGVYLISPSNFNNANCLPNKFFEFVQARLAVAVGPTPDMARLTKAYDFGVVAQDFSAKALADELKMLSATDIMEMKRKADKAARELNYSHSEEVFLSEIDRILDERWDGS
jgi:hypothetical protein